MSGLLARPEWRLLVALAIGLLIGVERERRKGQGTTRAAAGLRTFTLVCLLGGISAQFGSNALVVLAGAFTALAALLSYWLGDRTDPGLTTEVTLLVAFVLGVLAQTQPVVALGAGVVVTVLLAIKSKIHHFAQDVLTERELTDGLTFSVAALVVLPLLPNQTIDPFGIFNPFALWRLAVVLMALSAGGYIALRVLGPRYGLAITGFASGFVSSTAAIAAMGGRARDNDQFAVAGAGGAVASAIGSLAYLTGLVATANLDVLRELALPLSAAFVLTIGYAIFLTARHSNDGSLSNELGHAFDVKTILMFASLVAVFSLLSACLVVWFGDYGVLGGAVTTGLIDVHAAAVSIATLMASGKINSNLGALAILVALSTNMVSKIPAAFALGSRGFAIRVAVGLTALLVGLWAGYGWEVLNDILR